MVHHRTDGVRVVKVTQGRRVSWYRVSPQGRVMLRVSGVWSSGAVLPGIARRIADVAATSEVVS